jgi:hypothetical protein
VIFSIYGRKYVAPGRPYQLLLVSNQPLVAVIDGALESVQRFVDFVHRIPKIGKRDYSCSRILCRDLG